MIRHIVMFKIKDEFLLSGIVCYAHILFYLSAKVGKNP